MPSNAIGHSVQNCPLERYMQQKARIEIHGEDSKFLFLTEMAFISAVYKEI